LRLAATTASAATAYSDVALDGKALKGSFDPSSLDALKELGLTTLTLNLGGRGSLDALKELKTLTTLTLNVYATSVSSLDARLTGLWPTGRSFSGASLSQFSSSPAR